MKAHTHRIRVKRALAALESPQAARGMSMLIYHRIGAATRDELDLPVGVFREQLDILQNHPVLSLDAALDRLDRKDQGHGVVLTFDDGFLDVYENAWPLLRERGMPFTIYLATAYMGRRMIWEGSTAKGSPGRGLRWSHLEEMVESGLCTVGNHTHRHVRPEALTVEELDACTATVESHLGLAPRHFTYPWGIPVPHLEAELAARFRSSSTGLLGRNYADTDRQRLHRLPVRQSDPLSFFEAKLSGTLRAERAYGALVGTAKAPMRLVQRARRTAASDTR